MKTFLLALLLFHAIPQTAGIVTGMVRGTNGMPASGVRVFAIAAREGEGPSKVPPALESISVTDDSGRYRLQIEAGRYYIASGSVGSPTYSPGTPDIAAARIVRIAAGSVVPNVDFSRFVPATQTPLGVQFIQPPGSTGVLSGVIRFADGSPAGGTLVIALPARAVSSVSPSPQPFLPRLQWRAQSDASGNYRIENVPADTYYIAAGLAEMPVFYPGTSDIQAAKTIATTPATKVDMLDFTVQRPLTGVRITGRVTAFDDSPAIGATVQIRNQSPISSAVLEFGLQPRTLSYHSTVKAGGQFEYLGVLPGSYVLEAGFSTIPAVSRNIVVADQPMNAVDISLPIAMFSGRILSEDGSVLPDPQAFGAAILTTVTNPNALMSTIVPISAAGTFTRPMETDEYRFSLRMLPEGYTVKSVTSGDRDLIRETVRVGERSPLDVEILVAKKTAADSGEVRLSGRAIDAVTGAPSAAEFVTICCRESGIAERFSTPLRPDGSFEFSSIPPGHYHAGLQISPGAASLSVIESNVEVGSRGTADIEILSALQFVSVLITTVNEAGSRVNVDATASVVFQGSSPRNRIEARSGGDGIWGALLPAGDIYTASIKDLPAGFSVKSVGGPMDVRNFVPLVNAIGAPPPSPTVVITLSGSADAANPAR